MSKCPCHSGGHRSRAFTTSQREKPQCGKGSVVSKRSDKPAEGARGVPDGISRWMFPSAVIRGTREGQEKHEGRENVFRRDRSGPVRTRQKAVRILAVAADHLQPDGGASECDPKRREDRARGSRCLHGVASLSVEEGPTQLRPIGPSTGRRLSTVGWVTSASPACRPP
jgi:hypothetical protein